MRYEEVKYRLTGMRLSHQLLVILAEYPEGITAIDISYRFSERDYRTIHHTLQRLVMQGFLRREEITALNANNRPTILYSVTKKGKKKVNYLMNQRFSDWIPIPE